MSPNRKPHVGVATIAIAAIVLAIACSGKTTKAGGLEIIVATNLHVPSDFDTLHVAIRQQTAGGGWGSPLLESDFSLTSPSSLPQTISIAAGGSPYQEALIDVTALRGIVAIVSREVQIQIPKDRVAELTILISSACVGKLSCPATQTCDPTTGQCASTSVDVTDLPPYNPGDVSSVDAGAPTASGLDAAGDVTPDMTVPPTEAGPLASEASMADVATDGMEDASSGCTPAATQCSGNGVQVCGADGQWAAAVACDGGYCNAPGVCGVCASGATQCTGNSVQTCGTGGQWGAAIPCANQGCLAGKCQGQCSPGATQCSGTNSVETCGPTGVWGAATTCMSSVCLAGQCSGACSPGMSQCSGSSKVQICASSGQWGTPTSCTNQACVAGQCTGVCTPGTAQCSGSGMQICGNDGTWGAVVACAGGFCNGAGVCGVCSMGALLCSGNGVETCSADGTWSTAAPCINQACVMGQCTGVCTPGATAACTSVSGAWPCGMATCNSGVWDSTACVPPSNWCQDLDNDTFCSTVCTMGCTGPAMTRTNCPATPALTDCNDNDPTINPNTPQSCTSATSCVVQSMIFSSTTNSCQCTTTTAPANNGATCAQYEVCSAGVCTCNLGAACTLGCKSGTVSCMIGPACNTTGNAAAGTACGTASYCDGSGNCDTNCVYSHPTCVPTGTCVTGSSLFTCTQGGVCVASYVPVGGACIGPPGHCDANHNCGP